MAQLHILYTLQRNGEMPMSRLAEVLNVSLSNATGLIDRIEERGFIERTRVPEDRRIVLVRVTAGRRARCSTRSTPSATTCCGRSSAGSSRSQLAGVAQAIARPPRRARGDDRRRLPDRHPPPRRSTIDVDHARRRAVTGQATPRTTRKGLTTHGSIPGRAERAHPVARRGPRPRPEPPREDGDPLRRHARPVPRRARPDDRRSGAADHRHPAVGNDYYVWAITIYLLTSTISVPFWGKLSDLYGRKPIFMIGIVIFLVGSALSGLQPEHGDAHPLPRHPGHRRRRRCSRSRWRSSATCSRPQERGKYQGLFGAVFGIAFVVGPLIGGFLTENVGWHWIFYVNIPIGIVALIVIQRLLPTVKTPRATRNFDFIGGAIFTVAIGRSCWSA